MPQVLCSSQKLFLTNLVADSARSLAGRLARSLTGAAAAVFCSLLQLAFYHCFDMFFHSEKPPFSAQPPVVPGDKSIISSFTKTYPRKTSTSFHSLKFYH